MRGTVDPALREIHLILQIEDLEQGPKGSMQLSLAKLLLSATDGAASMFYPNENGIGRRFKGFIRENFPWDPESLEPEEACRFLWKSARCPLIHSFGLHTKADLRKFGRVFTTTDARLEQLESELTERPYSSSFIERGVVNGSERTVVWIDSYYWALRIGILKSLDSDAKVSEIRKWIKSGQWQS